MNGVFQQDQLTCDVYRNLTRVENGDKQGMHSYLCYIPKVLLFLEVSFARINVSATLFIKSSVKE